MSKRAEKAALKAYPKEDGKVWNSAFGVFEFDRNAPQREAFQEGYEQAEKDLGWHSVKESLPPTNEEVIVLTDDIHGKTVKGANYICFGHIVDKSITVDYNGWNISGVHHWMYCPKI